MALRASFALARGQIASGRQVLPGPAPGWLANPAIDRRQSRILVDAEQVHLDAARLGIESGYVLESIEREAAVQLAIDTGEQVQIEGRRNSQRIVVGLDELSDRQRNRGNDMGECLE